jgi:hypothetical protein
VAVLPPWDGGATWLNIPGATSTSYTFVASAIDDEGNLYRAVFTNVAGSATTNAALLTVAGPWPTPTQSGYIDFAFPAMFSEVQASWTVPTVTCPPGSTNTWVEQWPAISGSGNSIVQDGTGATCASGSPVYFAWWAIGGDPNITGGQPYAQFLDPSQYPVSAGDAINASVSISGSTWTLQVNDTTQNWTFTSNTPNTSPGLGQGEASVIVEGNSACYPPACHGLANFGAVHFTGATAVLNGQTGPIRGFLANPDADDLRLHCAGCPRPA